MRTSEAEVVLRLRAAGCVFAEEEAGLLLAAAEGGALESLVARREAGEPLEVVLGWAAFAGLRVGVAPGVFVPRRRTELLVTEAVARLEPGAQVVDLCCGTGAIGLAVAARVPVRLSAADVDPAAVACARANLAGRGEVYAGDLYDALPARLRGQVDALLVNAPYVPSDGIALMPPEARLHEPRTALDGGPDGVDVQRRVAAAAPDWLAPGGHLLVETGRAQAARTRAAFERAGLRTRVVRDDELEATVVVGTRAP